MYHETEATFIAETDAAILVDIEGEEFWIPKGQIKKDESEIYEGHERGTEGTLIMSEWMAREKGLI